MVAKTNKRIMITIPKDFDRLILKAKAYSLGESMTTSYLFCKLVIDHLYKEGYLNENQYNELYKRYFYD